jgi:hypothetical protein
MNSPLNTKKTFQETQKEMGKSKHFGTSPKLRETKFSSNLFNLHL